MCLWRFINEHTIVIIIIIINNDNIYLFLTFPNSILKITLIPYQLEDLRKTIEISLRDKAKLIDSFEKEKFILKEQLSALRKSYAILRNEHETVKNTLDKEVCDLKY